MSRGAHATAGFGTRLERAVYPRRHVRTQSATCPVARASRCRARARRCSARRPVSAPTWCSSTSRTRVAPLEKEAARDKVVKAINELDWGDTVALRAGERVGHRVDVPRRRARGRERGRAARRDHAAEGAVGGRGASRSTCCSPRSSRSPGRESPRRHRGADRDRAGPHQRRGDLRGVSDRLETIIFGPADFAASTEMPVLTGGVQIPEYPGDHFHYVFSKILMAGRANGLQVIDGPFLKIRELDALRDYAMRTRILGYDGKWALHPDQVHGHQRGVHADAGAVRPRVRHPRGLREGDDRGRSPRRGDVRRRDDRRSQPQDGDEVRHPRRARAGMSRSATEA